MNYGVFEFVVCPSFNCHLVLPRHVHNYLFLPLHFYFKSIRILFLQLLHPSKGETMSVYLHFLFKVEFTWISIISDEIYLCFSLDASISLSLTICSKYKHSYTILLTLHLVRRNLSKMFLIFACFLGLKSVIMANVLISGFVLPYVDTWSEAVAIFHEAFGWKPSFTFDLDEERLGS